MVEVERVLFPDEDPWSIGAPPDRAPDPGTGADLVLAAGVAAGRGVFFGLALSGDGVERGLPAMTGEAAPAIGSASSAAHASASTAESSSLDGRIGPAIVTRCRSG